MQHGEHSLSFASQQKPPSSETEAVGAGSTTTTTTLDTSLPLNFPTFIETAGEEHPSFTVDEKNSATRQQAKSISHHSQTPPPPRSGLALNLATTGNSSLPPSSFGSGFVSATGTVSVPVNNNTTGSSGIIDVGGGRPAPVLVDANTLSSSGNNANHPFHSTRLPTHPSSSSHDTSISVASTPSNTAAAKSATSVTTHHPLLSSVTSCGTPMHVTVSTSLLRNRDRDGMEFPKPSPTAATASQHTASHFSSLPPTPSNNNHYNSHHNHHHHQPPFSSVAGTVSATVTATNSTLLNGVHTMDEFEKLYLSLNEDMRLQLAKQAFCRSLGPSSGCDQLLTPMSAATPFAGGRPQPPLFTPTGSSAPHRAFMFPRSYGGTESSASVSGVATTTVVDFAAEATQIFDPAKTMPPPKEGGASGNNGAVPFTNASFGFAAGGVDPFLQSVTSYADPSLFQRNDRVRRSTQVDAHGYEVLNDYTILDEIGSGASGTVMLALHSKTDEPFAIKAVSKSRKLKFGRALPTFDIEKEVAVMKKLKHPNIVRLHEVIDDPEEHMMYLVMDYVPNGPILNMRVDPESGEHKVESMPGDTVLLDYAKQIAEGLRYLHKRNIVHRDIKPDNILLGNDGQVYISDFGVSEVVQNGNCSEGSSAEPSSPSSPGTFAAQGTPGFFAPEQCRGEALTPASDVWSFGVVLYLAKFGKLPFPGRGSIPSVIDEIVNDELTFPPDADEKWKDCICHLLEKDAEKRMTLLEFFKHELVGADRRSSDENEETKKNCGGGGNSPLIPASRKHVAFNSTSSRDVGSDEGDDEADTTSISVVQSRTEERVAFFSRRKTLALEGLAHELRHKRRVSIDSRTDLHSQVNNPNNNHHTVPTTSNHHPHHHRRPSHSIEVPRNQENHEDEGFPVNLMDVVDDKHVSDTSVGSFLSGMGEADGEMASRDRLSPRHFSHSAEASLFELATEPKQ